MNSIHLQNQISNSENFTSTAYHEGLTTSSHSPDAAPQLPQPGAVTSPDSGNFSSLSPSCTSGASAASVFPPSGAFIPLLQPPAEAHSQQQNSNLNYYSVISTPTQTNPQTQIQPTHPTIFFYQPPNDFRHYYVKFKEIPYDTIPLLLNNSLNGCNMQFNENEFVFYYRQQYNNRFYQASCEIVHHILINQCLNKNFLGIELQQNMGQENLAFTAELKENLEYHLKQRLWSHRALGAELPLHVLLGILGILGFQGFIK